MITTRLPFKEIIDLKNLTTELIRDISQEKVNKGSQTFFQYLKKWQTKGSQTICSILNTIFKLNHRL